MNIINRKYKSGKEPETVLITGASNGLGAELARYYAQPGRTIGLIDLQRDKLNAVAEECRQRGATVTTGLIDVTNIDVLADWLLRFDAEHPIDLLIANAGISTGIAEGNVSEGRDPVLRQIAVNLNGAVATIEPLLPAFRARGGGQVAVISSIASFRGLPFSPGYCASKAGLRAYGEALRVLLKPHGIHVSVISPGFFDSKMSREFPGAKHFIKTTAQAAAIIRRGLDARRARITFPLSLGLLLKLNDLLPPWLSDPIIGRYRFFIKAQPR